MQDKSQKQEYRNMKDCNGEMDRARKACEFCKDKFLVIALLQFQLLCWTLDTGNSRSSISVNEDSTVEKEMNGAIIIIMALLMNVVLSTDGSDMQAERTVHFSREQNQQPVTCGRGR